MQELDAIFYIIVLIMSIVAHEVSHGYAAERMGDPTARLAGRLTLNPLKHIDPIGSVILPALLIFSGSGFVFGWAKPVPYNPANLRDQKWGTVAVASAGILTNFFIAIVFGLLIRIAVVASVTSQPLFTIGSTIVFVNLLLGIFNLVPLPPLDGSKILFSFLPFKFRNVETFLEKYSLILLIFFLLFIWQYFAVFIFFLFKLLTGIMIT